MKRKGFTLIELLVVIAIIALLLSIMVPSLRIAKEYAAGAVCLTNQKNLCLAWTMYADDNETFLVGGSTYYESGRSNSTPYRWVEPPLRNDTDNPEKTGIASIISMETRENGIRAGKLFPYTQDPKLYHCPADRTFVKLEEPYSAYRSYAISGLMNGEHFKNRTSPGNIYSPIKDEYVTSTGKKLRVATKMGQISNPGSKFVFMEEDVSAKGDQQWNAGGFVLIAGDPANLDSWWDWPADFHNDSSTIGYADGHAERVRWHDARTLRLIKLGRAAEPTLQPGNEDLYSLIRGYFPMM
jgi:prepilin-type N-terminal cleavage/methylation domain-containing protein/prepilin-type processing-associated H-X9-DG protein